MLDNITPVSSPVAIRSAAAIPGVMIEPVLNQSKQARLLARFPEASDPRVNGEAAPCWVVLAPGDVFTWSHGPSFRVALFNKPQVGPPPAHVIGKPCPVCRVPFSSAATTVACLCGIVLHCEPDAKEGLQCAQLRRECPVCKRSLVLTEGDVDALPDED